MDGIIDRTSPGASDRVVHDCDHAARVIFWTPSSARRAVLIMCGPPRNPSAPPCGTRCRRAPKCWLWNQATVGRGKGSRKSAISPPTGGGWFPAKPGRKSWTSAGCRVRTAPARRSDSLRKHGTEFWRLTPWHRLQPVILPPYPGGSNPNSEIQIENWLYSFIIKHLFNANPTVPKSAFVR